MKFQTIIGTVVAGHKLGRKLGFPTANIHMNSLEGIESGVWLVTVKCREANLWGVANIGHRPSVNTSEMPIAEIHILDFNEDIYGEKLEVQLIKKIRDEKRFESVDVLREAITNDISSAISFISVNNIE